MKKRPTKKDIITSLKTILDPELGINIVDLGLVYTVDIPKSNTVHVLMTLTSIGCPLSQVIQEQISQVLKKLPEVEEVRVDFTFDPPWSTDRMSNAAKEELGYL